MSTTERDFSAMGEIGGVESGKARRAAMLAHADRAQLVERTVTGLDEREIGTNLLQSAVKLVDAVVSGEIPVPDTPLERKQLADAAKVVYMMARLQLGESTANVATAHVADRAAKEAELQARLDAVRGEDGQGEGEAGVGQ